MKAVYGAKRAVVSSQVPLAFRQWTTEPPRYVLFHRAFTPVECRQVIAARYDEFIIPDGVFGPRARAALSPDDPWIANRLESLFIAANRKYHYDLTGLHPSIRVFTYRRGDCVDWHEDAQYEPLKLSAITLLANDFIGGELEFHEAAVVLKAGDTVIFPSYTAHRVTRITRGRRVSLGAWAMGPRFR